MAECTIDGCDKKVLGRGMCSAHYNRWRKHGDPLKVVQHQQHGLSLFERIGSRLDKTGQCWEWTGSKDKKGYGRINVGNKPMLVHRAFFECVSGPLKEGDHVLHRCDNPSCARPEHLFVGDHLMNMQDKSRKKRHRYGVSRGEAHGCSRLTADQVYEIRASTGPSVEVGKRYGVSGRTVREIRNRESWRHLP